MKRLIQPAAQCLLALFAFAWPWDVYQYDVWMGLNGTGLAALGLAALWAADIVLRRRNRVTFELVWPPALLLFCLWAGAFLGDAPLPVHGSVLVLLFLATCHFAPSGDQSVRYLTYAAVSISCVAALSLLAAWGPAPIPTAYSLSTGATLAFAHDITGGALTLLVGLSVTLWWALDKRRGRVRRVAAAAGSTLILLAVLSVAAPAARYVAIWGPPDFAHASLWSLLALVTLLWLAARIAAKLLFAFREWNRKGAIPFLGILAICVLAAVALPMLPRSAYAFLLGLAAACGRAKHEPETPPVFAKWVLVPLAGMILLNMVQVRPENRRDPRNYNVAAARDLEDGALDLLERRMDFFERERPGERKTHFWRAHAALERGHPRRAALEFAEAMRPFKKSPLLPPPTEAEVEDFLVRLRDFCSSLPPGNSVFAYERALLAAGREDSALATLRLRIGEPSLDVSGLASKPFAEVLAELLLAHTPIEERLREWSPSELVSVLECWGGGLEQAPQGFPGKALPLVLAAYVSGGALHVRASGGDDAASPAWVDREADPEDSWESGGWGVPERRTDGTWVVALRPSVMNSTASLAEVEVEPEGKAAVAVADGLSSLLVVPAAPAIRMWIP